MRTAITPLILSTVGGGMLVLAGMVAAGPAFAQGVGAVVPLPAQMRAAAEQYLPGVVGDPVPAFTITSNLAALKPGSRTYVITSGDDKGQTEEHQVTPSKEGAGQWRYTIGDRTAFITEVPGESLSIVSEQDTNQGILTRYSPAQPLLIAGMNAGDTRTMEMKVSVFDLDDPTDLEHKGVLNVTLTYVGAYKVTVPAGTYDAALLRWEYKGKIGPATIEDIQARFVAKDVGMVAGAEKKDIAAMLIYSDHSKIGRVLQQP